jgi:hypothetical protein
MDLSTLIALRNRLAKVEADIRDMPTSYSQSNPSYVLGMRSLKRMRERLIREIELVSKT